MQAGEANSGRISPYPWTGDRMLWLWPTAMPVSLLRSRSRTWLNGPSWGETSRPPDEWPLLSWLTWIATHKNSSYTREMSIGLVCVRPVHLRETIRRESCKRLIDSHALSLREKPTGAIGSFGFIVT